MATKTPTKPYGNVDYADPGYQEDGKKRYPIDTEEHVRAALAYINQEKNAAKYSPENLAKVKKAIHAAAKKLGIDVAEEPQQMSEGKAYITDSLVAAAAPVAPPATWFQDPKLSGPTRMTITPEGQVFGHLAQWRVCHVGVGNACVMAPRSRTNYDLFKVGQLITDDGNQIPVGKITLGTGHANAQYGVMPSREHYDNTGWTAAIVNVGEDQFGIWVHGALANTMSPERIASLRASALSGDWRRVNGNLELIAALAVNSPGFPIYQENAGKAFSLVSVGVVTDGMTDADYDEVFAEMVADGEALVASVESTGDAVTDAQRERRARLDAIVNERFAVGQEERIAQLALLDQEREEIGVGSKNSPDELAQRLYYQAGGGQFRVVPEEDGDEMDGQNEGDEGDDGGDAGDGGGE